jgi:hypothetical protein
MNDALIGKSGAGYAIEIWIAGRSMFPPEKRENETEIILMLWFAPGLGVNRPS